MHVITISGKALAGKSTIAEMLQDELETKYNRRVLLAAYGDLLKYTAKTFFNWDGQKSEKGRTLLQRIGTDVIRTKHPNFWVDYVSTIVCEFKNEWDYVLLHDVRFANEIEKWKELSVLYNLDLTTIKIERPNFKNGLTLEQQQHESETALDNYIFHITLRNDKGLKELREKTNYLIEHCFEYKGIKNGKTNVAS